jgi:hypothetical protein
MNGSRNDADAETHEPGITVIRVCLRIDAQAAARSRYIVYRS